MKDKRKCEYKDIEEVSYFGDTFYRCKNCGHGQMEYKSDLIHHLSDEFQRDQLGFKH